MNYVNVSAFWGEVGLVISPIWYGERALALGIEPPLVVTARCGLVINGEVVATAV